MNFEIPKKYAFDDVEKRIYKFWEDGRYFQPNSDAAGTGQSSRKTKTFSVVIPPPNVTGRLHIGHALNNTIQDFVVRYKRMKGYETLWIPGTDHAGIATQTVVKKMLDMKGQDYRKLGREKFLQEVFAWKEEYGEHILRQIRSLGSSCDWTRTRFTMDTGLSEAVNEAFVRLYRDGLIYKGKRIVNWCPIDKTALSDDEVEVKPGGEPGFLYDIAYPVIKKKANLNKASLGLAPSKEHIVVSTTRPETMFGDVAVAVHPLDERYKDFIGGEVLLPLCDRTLPIIGDSYVDREFGTGALKITPAHDPNDFAIGKRHKLEPLNIMHEDASLNENVPLTYRGLSREKARENVLVDLKKAGFLQAVKPHTIPLGRSYRSKAIIEYRYSDQWFVRTKPLAEKLLRFEPKLKFHPSSFEKVYEGWLHKIEDWCISRQIWWGHRIPVWYNKDSGKILVATKTPKEVAAHPELWRQEDDVLDTWFSSALWPLSVMGWPNENSDDFKAYFPTNFLSTAKDIIFFWVARMGLFSLYFQNKLPFSDVYIHPVVKDYKGKTMSKSRGNGLDPEHVIKGANLEQMKQPILDARPYDMAEMLGEYEKNFHAGFNGVGADALRYTLLFRCSSQDLRLSLKDFNEIGGRFNIKMWNAMRFVLMNLAALPDTESGLKEPEQQTSGDEAKFAGMATEDAWMLSRVYKANEKLKRLLESYDFSQIGELYYSLFWNDFCDWYLEIVKKRLSSKDEIVKQTCLHFLCKVARFLLIMFHPLTPFITEELWGFLNTLLEKKGLPFSKTALIVTNFIAAEDFPLEVRENSELFQKEFQSLQGLITAVRSLKKRYNLKEKSVLKGSILEADEVLKAVFFKEHKIIESLCGLRLSPVSSAESPAATQHVSLIEQGFHIEIDSKDSVDFTKERTKLQGKYMKLEKEQIHLQRRLENKDFIDRAAKHVVLQQRRQHGDIVKTLAKMKSELAALPNINAKA